MIKIKTKKTFINMKMISAIFISLFISIAPLSAQELAPEHLEIARKYVDLTDQANIYEVSLLRAGVNTMKTLISKNPEIKDQLNEAIGKTIAEYAPKKDDLFNQFARIYALRFTIDELQEIVAFYESDVGKKLAKENAAVNKELAAVLRIFESNLNNEFFAKVRSKLKEKGIDL